MIRSPRRGVAFSSTWLDSTPQPTDGREKTDMTSQSNRSVPPSRGVESYGTGAIAFHWTMFLLIVGVGVLGLLHDSWPKLTQAFWINIHAMLGLLLWLMLIA